MSDFVRLWTDVKAPALRTSDPLTALVRPYISGDANTPFTRWSWLDELARCLLDVCLMIAWSCKRGIRSVTVGWDGGAGWRHGESRGEAERRIFTGKARWCPAADRVCCWRRHGRTQLPSASASHYGTRRSTSVVVITDVIVVVVVVRQPTQRHLTQQQPQLLAGWPRQHRQAARPGRRQPRNTRGQGRLSQGLCCIVICHITGPKRLSFFVFR